MKNLVKGDLARIAYVPCGVVGIEVGSPVKIIGEPENVGQTSSVKVEFLLEKGKTRYWAIENLEPAKASEIKGLENVSKQVEIIQRNPKSLKPHPKNAEIYGEDEDVSDLVEKIGATGTIHPLIVNQNDEIIHGNRRREAAIQLGIKLVPVIVQEFRNEIEELEALLTHNATRKKTNSQRANEARHWEKIEADKAEKRKNSNLLVGKGKRESVQGKQGRTADIVGEKVGLSGSSVKRSKPVLEEIERCKQEGDFEEAKKITQMLDASINSASNYVKAKDNYLKEKLDSQIEQGFPYKVGDICWVVPKKENELLKYRDCWGVLVEVKDAIGKLKVYGTILTVKREHLKKIDQTEERRASAEAIAHQLHNIGSRDTKQSIEVAILQNLSQRPVYELTPLEQDLLALCSKSHLSVIESNNDKLLSRKSV